MKETDGKETFYSRETVIKLMNCFYVDNCVTSVKNRQELDKFICESRNIMNGARMNLRGWEHSIIGDAREQDVISMVLGLKWNGQTDTLEINLDQLNNDFNSICISKRFILAIANKLFDPIGFLCPIMLGPKLLLQQAWSAQIGWDSEVPVEIRDQFLKWSKELKLVEAVKIPRGLAGDPKSWNLHTFCDASKSAYAAVVFLHAESENGVTVQLIQAKSRVAPMKELSIPRLKLLAALVGARLTVEVLKSLKRDDISCTMWSDSTTVLTWIQKEDQWATFVWNRVKEIRSLTNSKDWKHISGTYNPADIPSRGCSVKQLIESRWWEGPPWLRRTQTEWPISRWEYDENEVASERKKTISTITIMTAQTNADKWLYRKFSSYGKILILVAWI